MITESAGFLSRALERIGQRTQRHRANPGLAKGASFSVSLFSLSDTKIDLVISWYRTTAQSTQQSRPAEDSTPSHRVVCADAWPERVVQEVHRPWMWIRRDE
jgi:hypothetical protein